MQGEALSIHFVTTVFTIHALTLLAAWHLHHTNHHSLSDLCFCTWCCRYYVQAFLEAGYRDRDVADTRYAPGCIRRKNASIILLILSCVAACV